MCPRQPGPTAAPTAAAAATASAATPHSTTDPTVGCADCALSRCSVGAGADGVDLSARSYNGRALVREKSKSQRRSSRRCDAESVLGSERQRTNFGPASTRDDEREAGLEQPAW